MGLKAKSKTKENKAQEKKVENALSLIGSDITAEFERKNELESASETKITTAPQDKIEAEDLTFADFEQLAKLMNLTVSQLKDEFMLFQIRKLMSRMGKVVVRFNIPEAEFEKLFLNSAALEASEILVSPAYLPICEKLAKKHKLTNPEVCTIIDFPFGESSFKSKLNDLKESARVGVDGITVMIPTMLTTVENAKTYKKQVKRVGRAFKKCSGIALNATDLSEEQIKRAIRLASRTKLSHITFVFGEATLEELKTKMKIVNKHKGNKKIYVLANVDRAEAVMELFKLNVDKILTPYADAIGEELVKRFKVKSVKLK